MIGGYKNTTKQLHQTELTKTRSTAGYNSNHSRNHSRDHHGTWRFPQSSPQTTIL